MKTTSSSVIQGKQYNLRVLARPILVSLIFFLAVVLLRSIEVFVPWLDTLPDKSIFSRVAGIILVLGYLRVLRKPISSLGVHAKNFDKAFFIGGLSLIILYTTLYSIQFYNQSTAGEAPRFVFAAIDKDTGTIGSLFFTMFYLFGQIANAFMEEGIFRGVVLPHFMQRFSFSKANVLQAVLFGLAHLVWPFISWANGQITAGEAASEAGFLMVATTIGGLVFGYLYYRTNSLWTAIFAHLIDNAAGLFFHIQTTGRLNAETDILMLASVGFISLVILARVVANRSNLPTLKPWEVSH